MGNIESNPSDISSKIKVEELQQFRFASAPSKPITQTRTMITRPTSNPPKIPPQDKENRKYSQSLVSHEIDHSMVPVPDYLNETYWWAYVHPNAVKFFERQWLVNAILWGNFSRLRDWALDELSNPASGLLEGATLQIACVYGDLTPKMVKRLKSDSSLTVVDVVQAQLDNLKHKLEDNLNDNVHLLRRDASHLDGVADKSFDQVLLFFLLHEMPEETRRKTLAEATRVVKPGGKIIIVDYHRPHTFNPHRIVMYPVLKYLEPFALDIWASEVSSWLPESARSNVTKSVCFGGLYQKLIVNM